MQKLILIVDDEPMIRHLLLQLLRLDGYSVEEARDGLEALSKAKAHKPDLILMDYMMPNLDGVSASIELRQQPETADVPIIMLSAVSQPDIVDKGMKAGIRVFLDKSRSVPEGLSKAIQKIFDEEA